MKKLFIVLVLATAQIYGAANVGERRASRGEETLTQLVKRLAQQLRSPASFNQTINEVTQTPGRLASIALIANKMVLQGKKAPETLQPARDIIDVIINHHFNVASGDNAAAIAHMRKVIDENPAYLAILSQAAANAQIWTQVYHPQAIAILHAAGYR